MKQENICTQMDEHIYKLIHQDVSILWKCTLTDGTTVFSDYDRPGTDTNPWTRLKMYCENRNLLIRRVQVIMLGAPEEVLFENENGFDGLFIMRGSAKDVNTGTGESQSFQSLTAGVLRDDGKHVDIRKFCWPENEFEQFVQMRRLTKENFSFMLFKNDSEKKRQAEIQISEQE
jgi:hypothetical protein